MDADFKPTFTAVDNLDGSLSPAEGDSVVPKGLIEYVEAFGEMFKRLRISRRLSQQDLAMAAGVAFQTIRRAEQLKLGERLTWRYETMVDIIFGLERFGALTNDEREAFYTATGQRPGPASTATATALMRDRVRKRLQPSATPPPAPKPTDPDAETAHEWVDRLLDSAGAGKLLSGLEGLAAAWSVDLPPRLRSEDLQRRGTWAYVHPPERLEDREITRITPLTRSAAAHKPPLRKAQ